MATYYVSTTGSNSQAGSIDKPFASLQYAHNLAKPGDTIFIRGGTYNLTTGMQLTKDGTSGAPITVSNYGNEKVIFDGSKMASGYYKGFMLVMTSTSWNHIKGLEFRNGPDGGVLVRDASHNNIIEKLNVHHIGPGTLGEAKGIMLYGSGSNNLFLNNDSHDNRDGGSGGADGFQISTTGLGNVFRGNRAYGNSDDGFDLFNVHNGTNAAPVLLDGNWSFDNGFNASHGVGGDGTGFKLGGTRSGTGGTSGGHTVINNLAWDNRVYGFYENGANKANYLYNNTAYDNGAYNYLFSAGPGDTLTNNLSYGTGKILASGKVTNNSWNMSVTVNANDFVSLNDSIARGARNADGSLANGGFLNLVVGSDLIDRGIKLGYAFVGSAPDLGAFEYGAVKLSSASLASVTTAPAPAPAPENTIKGTGTSDTLLGTPVQEVIYGHRGHDKLVGKAGSDIMVGGPGKDQFVFGAKLGPNNVDTITDFSVPHDTILLNDSIFTKVGPEGEKLAWKHFWTGPSAHDASDRIIYDKTTGNVYYDSDGTGTAAQQLFAKISPNLALKANDFFVV